MRFTSRAVVPGLLLLIASGCPRPSTVVPDAGVDASVDVPDAGAARTDAIAPAAGALVYEDLDCTTAYTPPAELTGSAGLGKFGWTWQDLKFTLAWNMPNRFVNKWISSNDDAVPSARVRPQLVPATGYCLQQGLKTLQPDQSFVSELVRHLSPFARRDTGLDAMTRLRYQPPAYDLSGGNALMRALKGLAHLPNALPGAPAVPAWSEATETEVLNVTRAYPEPVQEALARLVLATGEAYLLKQHAIANADAQVLKRIHDQFRAETSYATSQSSFVSPNGGTVVADLIAQADKVDLGGFIAAAEAIGLAADEVRKVFAASGAIDAAPLQVLTPHGVVLIRTGIDNNAYTGDVLYGAALIVDVGGIDQWGAGAAGATDFWMSSAVVLDLDGDDRWGPETPDIESATSSAADVFSTAHGFSQGSGLFAVGLLIDAAGNDDYRASVYSQGVGAFGVGVLADLGGEDVYRIGHMGQGAGFFGVGALVDVSGADRFRVYSLGQGAGKPGGVGVLLDLGGDDDYLGYNESHGTELPGSGVQNYYQLAPTWAYNDGTKAHFMSACQGVGWGYRGDWLQPNVTWMGGFGALVDLGGGKDTHTADTFSMGQGFVYGFGFLYDDGGDDRYRSFWWGPAASAHMGIGLLVDEGGNDDMYVTRASAGFGYDSGVAWLIDRGGNDTYGGQVHYGEAYTYGLTFFINEGGDDTYNSGGAIANPIFGGVNRGYQGANLVGAFLDLGIGNDTYVNAPAVVGNSTTWYLDPVNPLSGQALDPAHHKGIGIDQ